MQPLRQVLTVFLLGASLMLGTAHAEPLTADEISGFIASLEDVEEVGEKFKNDETLRQREEEIEASNPGAETNWMANSISAMKGHEAYDELGEMVEDHGFSSPEEWGRVGDRVLKAYMAAGMDAEAGEMFAEMQRQMQEVQNDPTLSPEQKEMMRSAMESGLSHFKAIAEAPAEDIEAVRPFMDKLEQAFEAQGQQN